MVSDTTCNHVMGKTYVFGYGGPQAVPTGPCGKGRFKRKKTLWSEGGEMKGGARTEVEHSPAALD